MTYEKNQFGHFPLNLNSDAVYYPFYASSFGAHLNTIPNAAEVPTRLLPWLDQHCAPNEVNIRKENTSDRFILSFDAVEVRDIVSFQVPGGVPN